MKTRVYYLPRFNNISVHTSKNVIKRVEVTLVSENGKKPKIRIFLGNFDVTLVGDL